MTDAPLALRALKGHGTENDFIVLPDLDASLTMSAQLVRVLCDRHAGIGADGVLRVVRTKLAVDPEVRCQASSAEYFMDYYNADGSIAEMCGNGARVFARYLQQAGLVAGPVEIATRAGKKAITFDGDDITVDMGLPFRRPEQPTVNGRYPAVAIDMPNPHVVVELASIAELEALDLSSPPTVQAPLPEGQNVEFFVRTAPNRVRMRVHERGVGETRSCGTGICAVAIVAAGHEAGTGRWTVEVPGGSCTVDWTQAGRVTLTGPAVLVAEIDLDTRWLARQQSTGQP
jgi:diaminopimelate epimerase